VHHDLGVPVILLTLMITLTVFIGIAVAWVVFGRREVPRSAPSDVSFVTRAARADLYGDAVNEALLMRPGDEFVKGLVVFDDSGVDGIVNGTAATFGGLSGRLRLLQNGYVRSYALSLLSGAVLVVLALLAVNLA
jgi:NADH-quinone oxidoreductase subunit L